MARNLLLTSLLVIGSCLYLLVAGQNGGDTLEDLRVYTIGRKQVLTTEDGTDKVTFKDVITQGKGRRSQRWVAQRFDSTPDNQYRFINLATMDNFITQTSYIVNQTKNGYTLYCQDCKKCLSATGEVDAQGAKVEEVPCDAEDKKQQFKFNLQKDSKATTEKPKPDPKKESTTKKSIFPIFDVEK